MTSMKAQTQTTAFVQENKMGTAPIWSLLLKMALPIILSTAVQSLYNIVDGIFVSQISEAAMTAITLATPVTIALMAVGTGIAVGMNTMLSHALGQKKQTEVNHAAQAAVFLMLAAWLLSFVFAAAFAHPFMAVQTSDPEILHMGTQYLQVYLALGIGTLGQLVLERMLISTGKTMYSMYSQITGALLNLILDPVMIFGLFGFPAMGIAGAALATVTGQIIALSIALWLNLKKNHEIKLRFTLHPPIYAVKRILFLGVPQTAVILLNAVMMFGINGIIRSFSDTAIAAMGAANRITTLFYNLINAMASALTPIVAYNHGAGNKARIDRGIRYGYLYSIALTAVGTAVCVVFAGPILDIFSPTPQMKAIGVYALRIMACGYTMLAVRNVSTAIVQALGHSIPSILMDLCRSYGLLLPLSWLLSKAGILNRVFWAYPVADLTAALLGAALVRHYYKKDIAGL